MGFFFASVIRSVIELTGSFGSITSMKGRSPVWAIGVKSLIGLYVMFFSRYGFAECDVLVVMKMV